MPLPEKNTPPFIDKCHAPACNKDIDVVAEFNTNGLIYAECGDVVHLAYRCQNPECRSLRVMQFNINSPAFDFRNFILTPNPEYWDNIIEQVYKRTVSATTPDFLKFKQISAWTDDVPFEDVAALFRSDTYLEKPETSIPLYLQQNDFNKKLQLEMETGKFHLRRLYPDIPKFRNLLICIAPNIITEIIMPVAATADGTAPVEIEARNNAWNNLLLDANGCSIKEAAIQKLKSKGVSGFPSSLLDTMIWSELSKLRYDAGKQLRELSRNIEYEDRVSQYFQHIFKKTLYPVCTEAALHGKRKELLGWSGKVEKGKALFVDAPMGLGKTYSIVEVMANDSNLSAVIFMPTKRLCEQIVQQLKGRIARHENLDSNYISQNIEPVKDRYGNPLLDKDGYQQSRFKRDFLKSEVYYLDGINPAECRHYDEFINRYQYNWIIKGDRCKSCESNEDCRFRSHHENAPLARIVVTTHQQYDKFYKNPAFHKWNKIINGQQDPVERDFFIIDEDIVISKCYQPVTLDRNDFKVFTATVTDFIGKTRSIEVDLKNDLRGKIDRLYAQFNKCDVTSVIPSSDPDFEFPGEFTKAWEKTFYIQKKIIPDSIRHSELVGNHLQVIQHAIRFGYVVQSYERQDSNGDGSSSTKTIHTAYFPNPKSFDLSALPAHVFFDGTMLDEKFLRKKLLNIEFEKLCISVEPIWQQRVWQNVNTDLAQKNIKSDEGNVKTLVSELLNKLGTDKKYFFVTTKSTREAYLEKHLQQSFQSHHHIIGHYGNLRGLNEAKDCDVALMLGSFVPSDAVETAMALEFIQDNLTPNKITPTYGNLWTWKASKAVRVYKDEFDVIGELSKAYRFSEHRQAIARTRYFSHDVDFYVLAKDPISSYEPYLPVVETDQYRNDLFNPRAKRPDNIYDQVKEATFDWLGKNETVTATNIHNEYKIRRQTVGKYLINMLDEGLLVKASKTKYKFPD